MVDNNVIVLMDYMKARKSRDHLYFGFPKHLMYMRSLCTHTWTRTHMYVHTYVRTHRHMYTHNTQMCVHTYVHVHTEIR